MNIAYEPMRDSLLGDEVIDMTVVENKAVVRELIESVYSGNLGRIDELISPHFVDHALWIDRQGLRRKLMQLRRVFPVVNFVVEDLLGEGDRVAARVRCECFPDATRRDAVETIHSTSIFRLARGKVVEHWGHSDSFL